MTISTEVKTAIGRMITGAQSNTQVQEVRADLLDRYFAEPYGDEVEKRSDFVSSDVSDAVESTLPDLLDVFMSGDSVVEFQPVGPEDEEAAAQETDAVSHVFWKMNPGFLILLTLIRESLIQQNSYTKQGWVEKKRVSIEEYEDLTIEELYSVFDEIGGDEYEIISQDGFEIVDTPQGKMLQPVLGPGGQAVPIGVKYRCVKTEKQYEIINIPQEDFFVSADWHSVSLDGVPVCGHRSEMELGELRAMGFSVEDLKTADDEGEREQTRRRHDTTDNPIQIDSDDGDESTRTVTVYEAYVRADINDDGMAELCRVWAYGDGSKILRWEESGDDAIDEVSDHPFACVTPFIVPHRHAGRSLAELVTDIARVNTVLTRHTLDSIYSTLYPRPIFDGNAPGAQNLMDSLLVPDHGAPIDTNGIPLSWTIAPQVIDTTLPVMRVMSELAERRTGSVQYAQGMATQALNNAAEGTIAQVRDWVTQKKMVIARSMAETGLKDIFRRIHKDLRSGPHREMIMRLRNRWVPINPRSWRHRTDVTVAVGAGTGNRDTIREGLMLLGQTQEKAMMAGMPGIGPEQIRNTAEKMMATYGVEDIEPYWQDPANIPPPDAERPDPQQEMAQAQLMAMQAQVQIEQMKAQTAQMEAESKIRERDAKLAQEAQNAEREYQIKMADIQRRAQIDRGNQEIARDRLDMDEVARVREDDFKRDKLEADTLTAYNREIGARIKSAPPPGYGYGQ